RVVWAMAARVTTAASVVTSAAIAAVVVGGGWALASGRIDGARLTAVWLLALAYGGTVEHISRMVPDLQYALGAWARVQLLRSSRQEPAGGAGPAEPDPTPPRPTLPFPGPPGGAARPAPRRGDPAFP